MKPWILIGFFIGCPWLRAEATVLSSPDSSFEAILKRYLPDRVAPEVPRGDGVVRSYGRMDTTYPRESELMYDSPVLPQIYVDPATVSVPYLEPQVDYIFQENPGIFTSRPMFDLSD